MIRFGAKVVTITQLADDTTLFLSDIRSLQISLNIIYTFFKASGLRLNYAKTEIMGLGQKNSRYKHVFDLNWVKDRIYSLGTWFYKDVNMSTQVNYEERWKKLEAALKRWKCRKLTWYGKITVIKSLALSLTNYAILALPTPDWFITKVQTAINDYLWDGKPPKIKFKACIAEHSNGGIKLPDFKSVVLAQKAYWVMRILDSELYISDYLQSFLPRMTIEHFLGCNCKPSTLNNNIPLFYRQILQAWFSLQQVDDENKEPIIWMNQKVKIDNSEVFYKDWYDKGVIYVNDLMEGNSFLSYDSFVQKYDIRCNFLKFYGLTHALQKLNTTAFGTLTKELKLIKSREAYWKFTNSIVEKPSCIKSWKAHYNVDFTDSEWQDIFKHVYEVTKCSKLQEFQLKILHKVYATPSYVSNFDKNVNGVCMICNAHNNIIHWFYECATVTTFWQKFEKWVKNEIDINFRLKRNDIIFTGVAKLNPAIKFSILHAKWHIHRIKFIKYNDNNSIVGFINFIPKLKEAIISEKHMAISRGSVNNFEKRLGILENII